MPSQKPVMSDMVPHQAPSRKAGVRRVPKKQEEVEELYEEQNEYGEEEVLPRNRYRDYQKKEDKKNGSKILWLCAFLVIIALILVIGGLFSHATLFIAVKKFSGTVDGVVTFSKTKSPTTVFVASAEKVFTAEEIVPAIGVSGTDAYAAGTIRVYNSGSSKKNISKGALLRASDGVQYATEKAVTVPAQGKNPGQVDVTVKALEFGSQGNRELDDFSFESVTLNEGLTARSVTEITGGSKGGDATADPVLLEEAIMRVTARLSDPEVLMRRIEKDLPETMTMIPLVIPTEDVKISIDGARSDGVHILAEKQIIVLITSRAEFARMAGNFLRVPDSLTLTLDSLEGVTVVPLGSLTDIVLSDQFQARITGEVSLRGSLDRENIFNIIHGVSKKKAKENLSRIPELESVVINMTPPWRRLIPVGKSDVTLKIL